MRKIVLILSILMLASFVSAQTPYAGDVKINGVSAVNNLPVVKPGETVTVSYDVHNSLGSQFTMTSLSTSASPPTIEALVDQYLGPYYNDPQVIYVGWRKTGTKVIDLPPVLPAGEYPATLTVTYQTAGGTIQTSTYDLRFKIEGGLIGKALGLIVKVIPKSVASKILSLFG
ncbi:hypothetical protein ACFLRC_04520 [Candidatus Altiarchaeota archaeon]